MERPKIVGFARSLVPLALTAGAAALYLMFTAPSGGRGSTNAPSDRVSLGKDYYLSVAILEVSERTPEGELWDDLNGSAPDPFYEVHWRGSKIFKSTTQENSLIAKWSTLALDLKDLALKGGTTSLDAMVQAAHLTISKNESIEILFFDSDVISDDTIGQISLDTQDLRLGDTTYEYDGSSVKRVVLRVTDLTQTPDVSK